MSETIDYSLPELLRGSGVKYWKAAPLFIPSHFIDLPNAIEVFEQLPLDQINTLLRGKILNTNISFSGKTPKLNIVVRDSFYKEITIILFGDSRELQQNLINDISICASGIVKIFNNKLYLNKATLYNTESNKVLPLYPIPIRLKTEPVTVQTLMNEVISKNQIEAIQYLRKILNIKTIGQERALLQKIGTNQPSLINLLLTAHNPETIHEGKIALQKFRFLGSHSYIESLKTTTNNNYQTAPLNLDRKKVIGLLQHIPFQLTLEQKKVVNEIILDLKNKLPMRRLLNGEVGSGKTIYLIAVALAFISGYRTAVILPSAPLAKQIYDDWNTWFPDLNAQLVINTEITNDDGGHHCFIGTTALLSRLKKNVDFVTIDEEHLFGIAQKERLSEKNILYVSATPIPKTLAMVGMNNIKVSYLKKMFVKKNIQSRLFYQRDKMKIMKRIEWAVNQGYQCAVIYPLAESNGDPEKEKYSADKVHNLWNKLYPGKVSFIHGKMSTEEKLHAIDSMKNDQSDILVATTVIQTGLNLKRLRYLCVYGCENLGQSSLWQLKGRLSRLGGNGYFDLMLKNDNVKKETIKRLNFLRECNDGYQIALEDMKNRGIGNLTKKQSGAMDLIFPGMKLKIEDLENYLSLG